MDDAALAPGLGDDAALPRELTLTPRPEVIQDGFKALQPDSGICPLSCRTEEKRRRHHWVPTMAYATGVLSGARYPGPPGHIVVGQPGAGWERSRSTSHHDSTLLYCAPHTHCHSHTQTDHTHTQRAPACDDALPRHGDRGKNKQCGKTLQKTRCIPYHTSWGTSSTAGARIAGRRPGPGYRKLYVWLAAPPSGSGAPLVRGG